MVSDFLLEFFVNPICFPSQFAPYNVFNTAAYALLALAGAFLAYSLIKKEGIRVNEKFLLAVLPFIFFGSSLRVLEDAHALPRCVDLGGGVLVPLLFTSPGIYLFVAAVLLASFLSSGFVRKKFAVERSAFVAFAGWVFFALTFAALCFAVNFKFDLFLLLAPLAIAGLAFLALKSLLSFLKKRAPDSFEVGAFFGQCFDGAATFVGVGFAGYGEQHVVGNAVIDFGGVQAFLALKILFAFAVVYFARKEFESLGGASATSDVDQRNFVLLLVAIMGLAPGLRDVLRVAAGV